MVHMILWAVERSDVLLLLVQPFKTAHDKRVCPRLPLGAEWCFEQGTCACSD